MCMLGFTRAMGFVPAPVVGGKGETRATFCFRLKGAILRLPSRWGAAGLGGSNTCVLLPLLSRGVVWEACGKAV